MGFLYFLGNFLLSVVGSILGNKIEPQLGKLRKRRKKEKAPNPSKKEP